jgi:hypothetical protein
MLRCEYLSIIKIMASLLIKRQLRPFYTSKKLTIMRIYHFILMLFCGLVAACNSADPTFPCEETLTQELLPLQGITCPITSDLHIVKKIKRSSFVMLKRAKSYFEVLEKYLAIRNVFDLLWNHY